MAVAGASTRVMRRRRQRRGRLFARPVPWGWLLLLEGLSVFVDGVFGSAGGSGVSTFSMRGCGRQVVRGVCWRWFEVCV